MQKFQTLRAITKFAAQEIQNRQVLYDLDAIKFILPHIEHHEVNIRRFALKALAQLCQLPRGPEQVLVDSQNLRKIAFMLAKVTCFVILLFSRFFSFSFTLSPSHFRVSRDNLSSQTLRSPLTTH